MDSIHQNNKTDKVVITEDFMEIGCKEDMLVYDPYSIAIICTDNIKSKNIISQYFTRKIICGCDKDKYEIRTTNNEKDKNTWEIEQGYTNEQDIISNIETAIKIIEIIQTEMYKYQFKITGTPETTIRKQIIEVAENEN